MQIEIKPNQEAQEEFLKDFTSKECLYLSGFGGGKTWAGSRKLLLLHLMNKCNSLVVTPTFGDLFRIAVPAIQSALDEWKIPYKTYPGGRGEQKFPFIDVEGHPILLLSGDSPERLVGFEVGAIWCDESARLKQSDIPMKDVPTLVRGRLRNPNAKIKQIIHTSTPEGTDSFLYTDFVENITDERKIYIGSTVKNTALPEDYINSLKSSYSSKLQDAYLHGQFINASANLQIWAFSRKFVTSEPFVKEDEGIAFLTTDENVSPIHALYGRFTKDKIWFEGEIYIKDNANVRELSLAYNEKDKFIHLYGDSSINKRNTVGEPFVKILKKELSDKGYKIKDKVMRSNPSVYSSCEGFNKLIEDEKVRFHPSCKEFIKQLENAQYKTGTLQTDKSGGKDPHGLDAARMFITKEFGKKPATRTINISYT